MDHKKNYIQLYNGVVQASDLLIADNVSGFIQLGILIESLKVLIDKLSDENEECDECDESIPKDKEKYVENMKSCLDSLKELRKFCEK